jgi:ABC-type sugar transport system permease subunit
VEGDKVGDKGKASGFDRFEEYRLFVEDTARFTERRQTVNNTYVAVNSIILSAIALIVKDVSASNFWRALIVIPVLVAGIVICLQWTRLILKYKGLVGFRMEELRAIEDLDDMADSSKMYHAEDRLYPRDKQGNIIAGQGLNFSDRERWLPRVFMGLYALSLAGIATFLLVVL